MPDTNTSEFTTYVAKVGEGRVVFDCLARPYFPPPHLEPFFREALATRREVTFTHDDKGRIYTAAFAPPLPLLRQLRNKVMELVIGIQLRRRGWGR